MGRGISGLYRNTIGATHIPIELDPVFVEKGPGFNLKQAADWVKTDEGFTDVVIHGNASSTAIMHNGNWVFINQRSLSKMIKNDFNYRGGDIRLLSCSTGSDMNGFAQNLANKMGVKVKAPSDKLWIYPNGKMIIGENRFKNTGRWITFYPGGKTNERKD